ncbi:MAG: arylsulfatase A-like enzyme [Pirellulaceae bacterium]|jgi:arylsulfatase A-like enzyme
MRHGIPLFVLCVLSLTVVLSLTGVGQAAPPNVVVILTDDQGWGDLSLNGNTNLSTPNIDALARAGASFERFYVCPVCSPTRAEFLTGRYHLRSGVFSTSAGGERMDLDEMTIADTFKAAGYATAAFGKWHNGMQYPYHPNGRGFDEYYGFCSGHWGDYFSPPLEHNGKIVKGEGFVIDDFTNRAMQFIETNKDKPFFVYLPYNTPHSPMQVPAKWWKKFAGKELELRHREPNKENVQHTLAALAMCENIDWNVGRIVNKLDELKIADNTIVVYFCDNGPNGSRWNGGMKGRKGSTDEGGVRSPLIVRWPKTIPAGREIKQIGGAIDLLPTLAELAGVKVASKKPLDGISLKPQLLKGNDEFSNRSIFSHWNGKFSVRNQLFRLDYKGKLFDMSKDPGQYADVTKQHPDVAASLQQEVLQWRDSLTKDFRTERTFPLGHADYKYTQIPARDGVPHGEIERSNRFPNCSFFGNWTRVEDKITWDTEVLAGGTYEVEMHYACTKENVGSKIKLTCGEGSVTATISKPHDPPLRGGENDRVKRAESYVKDFTSMTLGTIELKPGRAPLTLQALEIPGSEAMEFRLLMFTRVVE